MERFRLFVGRIGQCPVHKYSNCSLLFLAHFRHNNMVALHLNDVNIMNFTHAKFVEKSTINCQMQCHN